MERKVNFTTDYVHINYTCMIYLKKKARIKIVNFVIKMKKLTIEKK